LFCGLITTFTILFIFERARINGEIHSSIKINGVDYSSINGIKDGIGKGVINSPEDLVSAYNQLFA
jgi:hypothetical protein